MFKNENIFIKESVIMAVEVELSQSVVNDDLGLSEQFVLPLEDVLMDVVAQFDCEWAFAE